MSYTASGSIERLKSKGWLSSATSLTDAQILDDLNDSLRSYVVPFLKEVRDEWFVSGVESLTPDSGGRVEMPNSVASTVRIVEWMNNGQPIPLDRIEPELAYLYESNGGSGVPVGFVLRGYGLQILPTNIGSVTIRLRFMERPADMVLDDDAALIGTNNSGDLWNCSVPLAWQEDPPTTLAVISSESPFSELGEVDVASVNADSIEFSGSGTSLIETGVWVSDVGTSPFPNVPIEFHPLLQLDVIRTLFEGLGDKRLDGIAKRQDKMEKMLRKTMAPRTQGTARPIINPNAPGMRSGRVWGR